MRPRFHLPPLIAAVALSLTASVATAQKTDILVLQNGDRITGEIKDLDHGLLRFSTDDAGTLHVQWDKVSSLTSIRWFEVELTTERKVFGTLSAGPESGTVEITGEVLPLIAIVSITEISPSFWERTSGFLDLGWTLAKANNAHTSTLNAGVRYRGEKFGGNTDVSFYQQGQDGADPARNAKLSLDINRYIGIRWAARFFWEGSRDEARSLDFRTLFSSAARRRIIRTNRMEASWSAGLVGTREHFTDGPDATYSAEVLAAVDFSAFRWDSPKLEVTSDLKSYTSLTESERFRADLDLRVRYELFNDFFVALTLTSSFDTNSPGGDPTRTSYTSGLSVGWSW